MAQHAYSKCLIPIVWGAQKTVSVSAIEKVKSYIRNQQEYHHEKTFTEEFNDFLSAYGFEV